MIPSILHQTWRDAEVPDRWRGFQASWRQHHPAWDYRLWTDADNRALIARHYPWFLPHYDAYDAPIKRADAARYFIMHRHGGVYVDLDFECLRPLDALLTERQLLFGLEPEEHASVAFARASGLAAIVGNAFLASAPGHPFWPHLFRELLLALEGASPLDATGPLLLTRAHASFPARDDSVLLPSDRLYPLSKHASWQRDGRDADRAPLAPPAYAVHHWHGSWWSRTEDAAQDAFGACPLHLMEHARIQRSTQLVKVAAEDAAPAAPLVTCMMVTRDRLAQAARAIACFRAQTYARCELVLVDDGPDVGLAEHVAALADPRIRYLRLPDEGQSLGTLRNLAVAHARGELVAQWDDDDLYDPLRLEAQVRALSALDADACLLLRELLWWPLEARLAVSRPRLWEGSLLCRRASLVPYPDARRGEDTPVVGHLSRHARLALLDWPELYVYSYHHANTFGADHFDQFWTSASERYTGAHYDAMLTALTRRIPVLRDAVLAHPPGSAR